MIQQPIQILDQTTSLEATLLSIKNSRVDIAVAFASKVEHLIDTLLKNGNTVSLIIGTINHFTDPAFILHCQKLSRIKSTKLNIFVDFRGDNSIHWKLYLIGPSTIIIGSSNLTSIGVSMKRDTAIIVQDAALHQSYLTRMIYLKRDHPNDILHSQHAQFEQRFKEYQLAHRKTFGQMLASNTSSISSAELKRIPVISFIDWIDQEKSHILPLFIWSREVSEEEKRIFEQKVVPLISENNENFSEFCVIGIYEESSKRQDYQNGEIVLMMRSSGSNIQFELIDMVIYYQEKWWLCGLNSHTFKEPFELTSSLKKIIRQKRNDWILAGKTYLNSKDLRELAVALKAVQ
jgi:hypothetical protein